MSISFLYNLTLKIKDNQIINELIEKCFYDETTSLSMIAYLIQYIINAKYNKKKTEVYKFYNRRYALDTLKNVVNYIYIHVYNRPEMFKVINGNIPVWVKENFNTYFDFLFEQLQNIYIELQTEIRNHIKELTRESTKLQTQIEMPSKNDKEKQQTVKNVNAKKNEKKIYY